MICDRLLAELGPEVVTPGHLADPGPFTDWTGQPPVVPQAVVRPRDIGEVGRTLAICNQTRTPVVPQGGHTGLAGGARPLAEGILLCLDRLAARPEIDVAARVARVQAGVTLEALHKEAGAKGMMFPVDLGARGSCQIGGMISTNAGGMRAFREGVIRQNVLGLEAVLPDGTVLSAMNGFLKNNTGLDLKQLFIGAEGTMGVVTAAVLRLRPARNATVTALLAVADLDGAIAALERLDRELPGLSICEIMWPGYYRYGCAALGSDPLPGATGPVLLVEIEGEDAPALEAQAETAIGSLFEAGLLQDGALAQNLRQSRDFWALREVNQRIYQDYPAVMAFDVSLSPRDATALVGRIEDAAGQLVAGLECLWFGHLGDMNLHLAVVHADPEAFAPEISAAMQELVLSQVIGAGGSISAEHGIGAFKRGYVPRVRTESERGISRALRDLFDPQGIMNPGRFS